MSSSAVGPTSMRYELYYWPTIQGRGEFVRLALEEAGADYVDVARRPRQRGVPAMMKFIEGGRSARPQFAPPFLNGGKLTYADLSLFQIVEGLRYAFPRRMKRFEREVPRVVALHDRVAQRPRIAAYLASKRRIPFSQWGIYRYFKELDR